MGTTITYTAVLDRIVDGETAVLLLEDDGEVVDELAVPVDRLPADGAHEGAVFDVECEVRDDAEDEETDADETLLETNYRPKAERERRDRAQDRFDRLSERLSDEERERNEGG